MDVIAGRYRVERELGRGGMATVYLCTDSQTGDLVALKVLRPELGSSVVVERFFREIKFASELDHPRIPKVLDSGMLGDLPFYVMSYVEGESLRDRLDRVKQMEVEEAIRITRAVIEPMAYAHARGIVHRDIKPGNIFLAGDNVYVLDFGIARAIVASSEDSLTSTGIAVGTPSYMSPEQALSDQDLDTRSDIYSLACVTYEMIAGIPPFVGATPQAVMARRFVAPAPPLRETREAVSEGLEKAVAKALARTPADRWQRVEDFGAALDAPLPATSTHMQQMVLDKKRRNYAVALLVTAVVAFGGMGAVAWSVVSRDHVARGRAAIEDWDFAKARVELQDAAKKNPDDAAAKLWLGQLLMLEKAPVSDWEPLILRAVDARSRLTPNDRARAEALAAFADEDGSNRCGGLRTLASNREAAHLSDFSATLSLADCLAADRQVVADRSSPSGYRFASSYHQAAQLYQGIIERNSSNGVVYKALIPRLQFVLSTNKNTLRSGFLSSGETETNFVSMAELVADTVAHIPFPILGTDAPFSADTRRVDRAVVRNVERLTALAAAWTKADPRDPDSHETLALLLEAGGKLDGTGVSALSSLAAARAAASRAGTDQQAYYRNVRLANANTRVLVKLTRFREARALADTVVSWHPTVAVDENLQDSNDKLLTGLFALTGRMASVIDLEQKHASDVPVRLPSGELKTLPATIGSDAGRLGAYAAFGTPRDSIIAIYERISSNLEALVPGAQVAAFRGAVLRRPLSFATDVAGTRLLAQLGPSSDPFIGAIIALDHGNRRLASKLADSLEAFYADNAPGEITMDVVFQGAWLRTALGDSARAALSLDRALRGLSRAPPSLLRDKTVAACLVRAIILRSRLAAAAGDAKTSQKWADAAQALWGGGDPELRASVAQLRQ